MTAPVRRHPPKAPRSTPKQSGRVHPTPGTARFRRRGHECLVRFDEDRWVWSIVGPQCARVDTASTKAAAVAAVIYALNASAAE